MLAFFLVIDIIITVISTQTKWVLIKLSRLFIYSKGVIEMLKPLADHVVVEVVEKVEKTASGIYLPDTASKEKPQQGLVIAVGEGKYTDNGVLVKPQVKAGDEVVFAKYSGTEVKHEGRTYLILSERDLLAVIEK